MVLMCLILLCPLGPVTVGFGESGDPSCIIMQIWAKIEVSSVVLMMFMV